MIAYGGAVVGSECVYSGCPLNVGVPLLEEVDFQALLFASLPPAAAGSRRRTFGELSRVARRRRMHSRFQSFISVNLRSSAVVLSFASRILHSSHFLGRQIKATTKQPIEMALVGEASHLSNFGNGETVIGKERLGPF